MYIVLVLMTQPCVKDHTRSRLFFAILHALVLSNSNLIRWTATKIVRSCHGITYSGTPPDLWAWESCALCILFNHREGSIVEMCHCGCFKIFRNINWQVSRLYIGNIQKIPKYLRHLVILDNLEVGYTIFRARAFSRVKNQPKTYIINSSEKFVGPSIYYVTL